MKKLLTLATLALLCVGCSSRCFVANDRPISPDEYQYRASATRNEYADQVITHEEANKILAHLEDRALAWWDLYGKKL